MARVTRRAAVFVEHATRSGPAQSAVCSLIMGGPEAPAMRPSVELRAKSSPSRQAEHDPDCAFSRATWPAVPVLAASMASSSSSAAMACTAVAGWGPVRNDAVTHAGLAQLCPAEEKDERGVGGGKI
jgi:hypothetical protein